MRCRSLLPWPQHHRLAKRLTSQPTAHPTKAFVDRLTPFLLVNTQHKGTAWAGDTSLGSNCTWHKKKTNLFSYFRISENQICIWRGNKWQYILVQPWDHFAFRSSQKQTATINLFEAGIWTSPFLGTSWKPSILLHWKVWHLQLLFQSKSKPSSPELKVPQGRERSKNSTATSWKYYQAPGQVHPRIQPKIWSLVF